MGLYQRITATDNSKISVHRFGAALRQWAAGQLTRQDIVDRFALDLTDQADLDLLKATYDALPTNNAGNVGAKVAWLHRMEDVFLLCETGDYTEPKAKAALGI